MNGSMAEREKTGSARSRRTAQDLRDRIVHGEFPLHSQLPPERTLCQRLGVTRTGLRSALQILEAENRIWRHVGKGTFVGGRPSSVHSCPEFLGTHTTLSELLEARHLIEPIAARLAALRAHGSDLDLLERYYRAAASSPDWESWNKWDELFHRALAEASANGFIISIIDHVFRAKGHSRWCITRAPTFNAALKKKYSAHHADIVNSVVSRDCNGAETAMQRHIAAIAKSLGPALA
jgi:DNA-binding FadR family transcriptional regulator